METKTDKTTAKSPFTLERGELERGEGIEITFHDNRLYKIFKAYMENTKMKSMRDVKDSISMSTYYETKFDETKKVKLANKFGLENVIGKFFLETDLDWPEWFYENTYHILKYKQPIMAAGGDKEYGKGVSTLRLARQGKAEVPDHIMKMMNEYPLKKEIKKIVPLVLQDRRTSDKGFFTIMNADILENLANHLEPHLNSNEAKEKWTKKLEKAHKFYSKIKTVFSYEGTISFSRDLGTHVQILPSEAFKTWLSKLPLQVPCSLQDGYKIFKINPTTVAINKGPGTIGIQIKEQGKNIYQVCNNLTADASNPKIPADEVNSKRAQNLLGVLFDVKRIVGTINDNKEEPNEKQADSSCVMQ
jgi:hypothetical protein